MLLEEVPEDVERRGEERCKRVVRPMNDVVEHAGNVLDDARVADEHRNQPIFFGCFVNGESEGEMGANTETINTTNTNEKRETKEKHTTKYKQTKITK